MFASVLIANRGEIAVRIIRTLRTLGVRSVAVYSDADRRARHVVEADEAVRIGPAPTAESYLSVRRIVDAADAAGVDAVHPGYGFLSENPALARACADVGVTFVGPSPEVIEIMGDKINAKRAALAAGVAVVPGSHEPGLDDAAIEAAALAVGLPVLLKPSAGGGGKGMRRVTDPSRLREEIAAARREAAAAFGDSTLLVERLVSRPRHVEIQILADEYGACVHLGERECSLQRRHQKIVEEAPSPLLDPDTRAAMGASAVAVARSVGYTGAGTVEFVVSADRPDEYLFLEMNTRLQVEHPVTEAVTGLDLVELQLRVAAGEPLTLRQDDVVVHGHAVEARVYAEDPSRGFLPATGTVALLEEVAGRPGVRVDSGLRQGAVVGPEYDPMLAKVIASGRDRGEAMRRLDGALAATTILGVTTNVGFLRRLLAEPEVIAGQLDTELVERLADSAASATETATPSRDALVAAAILLASRADPSQGALTERAGDPWDATGGWRLGGHWAEACFRVEVGGQRAELAVTGPADRARVRIGEEAIPAAAALGATWLDVVIDGRRHRWSWVRVDDRLWLGSKGQVLALTLLPAREQAGAGAGGSLGAVNSPMPGTVRDVPVSVGRRVAKGDTLAVVEAMKMEYAVTAPADGLVTAVHVAVGDTVALDQGLVDVGPLVAAS